jgi:hypothetical protein
VVGGGTVGTAITAEKSILETFVFEIREDSFPIQEKGPVGYE